MAATVFVLCALTSAACAVLLLQSYRRNRNGLLLWSGVAFIFLAANNFLVLGDLLLPEYNLLAFRYACALIAICILIYGFIWEVD